MSKQELIPYSEMFNISISFVLDYYIMELVVVPNSTNFAMKKLFLFGIFIKFITCREKYIARKRHGMSLSYPLFIYHIRNTLELM